MSIRRPYKKSRAGCSSCKARHVKCDETGPPCANCRVRNLDCDFELRESSRQESSTPEVNSSLISAIGSRNLELELLHQWTCTTYEGFSFQEGDDELWKVAVPRAALLHDYLLNSIFATSALHLSSTQSSLLAQPYRLTAIEYQNLAVNAFRVEDRPVTAENAQVLFAFASINLVLAIAFPSLPGTDSHSGVLDNLNTVLGMLQGTVSIFTSCRWWLADGPFRDIPRRPKDLRREDLDLDTKAAFDNLRFYRDDDYRIRSRLSGNGAEAVRLYEATTNAIDQLETYFTLRDDGGQIVPFSWLAGLHLDFIEGIGRRDPLALLVMMHWAILLNILGKERWWARSTGKILVAEISSILLSIKPEWLSAISWVHGQVGLPRLSAQDRCL